MRRRMGGLNGSILPRVEALGQAALLTTIPPLTFSDVTQLPYEDRGAYWSGNVDFLNRYALPIPHMPRGPLR